MGVYGLTSYVAEHEKELLKEHKLHNCVVLLDGNSMAAQIYGMSKCNYAFGGDYDKYSNKIKEFLLLLQKCNIRPVILMDGAYEQRKLKTVLHRLKINVHICGQYRNKYKESKCFPLLLRDVFKDTVRELGVPIVQCDFEADQELIILSRILQWPVISYDSDFFLSDVYYIPFNSIQLTVQKFRNVELDKKYHLICKLYKVDNLFKKFGGLKDKSLLPLMSGLLGNDYIPTNTFKGFLSLRFDLPFDKKLKIINQWLKNVGTVDGGIHQMVSVLSKQKQKYFKIILKNFVNDYNRNHSDLLSYIPHDLYSNAVKQVENFLPIVVELASNCEISENEKQEVSKLFNIEEQEFIDTSIDCITEDIDSDDDIIIIEDHTEDDSNEKIVCEKFVPEILGNDVLSDFDNESSSAFKFVPQWLLAKFRAGFIAPSVMNIIHSSQIFINSQSEDYSVYPSHEISLPILRVIAGLITFNPVKCHARIKSLIAGTYNIQPVHNTKSIPTLPSLFVIPEQDINIRLQIFFDTLDIDCIVDLNEFPPDWALFVIALIYWVKNCKTPQVTKYHLRAIIICTMYLYIVDDKIGYIRMNRVLQKSKLGESSNFNDKVKDCTDLSIKNCLAHIDKNDCFLIADSILDYHKISANLLHNRKNFDIKLVHAFAQLQSCIQNVSILNSILDFPFPTCHVSKFLTCTLLYNLYEHLKSHRNVDEYVTRNLFSKATTFISLYRILVHKLDTILNFVKVKVNKRVKNKKSKQKRKNNNDVSKPLVDVDDDNDDSYYDPNNIYSLLSFE